MKIRNKEIEDEKAEIKKSIENAELLFRKLEYEYEVKYQQYVFLERERDALYAKFNEAIYEIQQKTGLKVEFWSYYFFDSNHFLKSIYQKSEINERKKILFLPPNHPPL